MKDETLQRHLQTVRVKSQPGDFNPCTGKVLQVRDHLAQQKPIEPARTHDAHSCEVKHDKRSDRIQSDANWFGYPHNWEQIRRRSRGLDQPDSLVLT